MKRDDKKRTLYIHQFISACDTVSLLLKLYTISFTMARRRSKRKATVLENLLEGGRLRRSARKEAKRQRTERLYGDDFGILPSD